MKHSIILPGYLYYLKCFFFFLINDVRFEIFDRNKNTSDHRDNQTC